ncbi:histidinol-phosphatase HisJ family protein [Brachyspira pilosicoli]|uniref:histidinol-phosphatase HisJ family protein n=1 Tax=Brachyspira pilosicoli TaxID=52584 RepID=UPI002543E640|nr:histidinol-phosphatase HisJ family protein [Brachyspira pilosicoli]WIH85670.1 histidinol-phosphatase HisJ family protein [Brachyspira pilosicoli]
MLADYHVHTEFSDDSNYPLEEVIKDAIKLNIDDICITDHVDYGIKKDWDEIKIKDKNTITNVNYPKYIEDINKIKEKYSKQINIKTGLECGIQTHTIDKYEALLKKYNFDFIIFSVHQVDNKEFWTQDFQRDKTQKEYNEAYYKEMLEVVKSFKNYSVLWHLDLIIRYDKKGIYPFEKVKPIIEDILKIVIEDGKGIEFNTSYTRYGLKDTTPSIDILKLYYKLGGNIITIGSDSHQPSHLGFHINEAKEILKNIGFKQFCTYNKMIPEFHNL